MFSSDAGRRQLSSSAGFDRLVVVSLHRNHTYTDLAAIQAELSAKVMELAPPGFKLGTKVMILQILFFGGNKWQNHVILRIIIITIIIIRRIIRIIIIKQVINNNNNNNNDNNNNNKFPTHVIIIILSFII